METLNTRMWIKQDATFEYPEKTLTDIYQRPNIGVCFSGGGTRAMTAAMGQMRALNKFKLFPAIRYISCVSGGSWASTIFCYYRQGATDDQALLGPVTPANGINQQHLNSGLNSSMLAYGATRNLLEIILKWELSFDFKYTSNDVWIYSISQAYLQDFGLFDYNAASHHPDQLPYYSWDQATVDTIKFKNPSLQNAAFYTSRDKRPYLIVNACILLPQDDPSQNDNVHFEYTPLTVGRPTLSEFDGRYFGGGFIEPFAYRSEAPQGNGPWINGDYVSVAGQDRPFTLNDTTGTSSSAYAEEIIDDFSIDRFDPKCFYFPQQSSGALTGAQTYFGDGGILENIGIIPLIQRGVKTIFAFVNTQTKLSLDYVPNANPNDQANDPNGVCDTSLPALFGYSNDNWKWYYPNNQVFPSEDFPKLISALQSQKNKDEPLIIGSEHSVVKNNFWGVAASNDKVKVIWFYLDRCKNWEKALGDATIANEINQGNQSSPSGPFENFPNYLTINQNAFDLVKLTPEQIVLMADFTCDAMLWNGSTLYADTAAQASK